MIDDLKSLSPRLHEMIVRITQDAIDAGQQADDRSMSANLGLTSGAMRRAGLYFNQHVSADDADISNGAASAFTIAWALGEKEAMQRVMVAISSPAARGREIEVAQALMNGMSLEDALAARDSAASLRVTETARVVAFPSRRVTERREDE